MNCEVEPTADVNLSSSLAMRVNRGPSRWVKAPFRWRLRNWLRMLASAELILPLWVAWLRLISPRGVMFATAELRGRVTRSDGTVEDFGVLGRHLVTTAGKTFLASAFANSVEPEVMKYAGFGTGTAAAVVGDTALQTELTTQYATDNTRPTGSQSTTGATYTTIATLAPDAAVAVTEWGLFSQASNAGGTLFDRQVFAAVNLGTSDTLAVTYVLTIS